MSNLLQNEHHASKQPTLTAKGQQPLSMEKPAAFGDEHGNVACVDCNGTSDSAYCYGSTNLTWSRYSKNCTNCNNCSMCHNCQMCEYCINCTNCTNCENCTDCNNCVGCKGCTGCNGCTPKNNCGCQDYLLLQKTKEEQDTNST